MSKELEELELSENSSEELEDDSELLEYSSELEDLLSLSPKIGSELEDDDSELLEKFSLEELELESIELELDELLDPKVFTSPRACSPEVTSLNATQLLSNKLVVKDLYLGVKIGIGLLGLASGSASPTLILVTSRIYQAGVNEYRPYSLRKIRK